MSEPSLDDPMGNAPVRRVLVAHRKPVLVDLVARVLAQEHPYAEVDKASTLAELHRHMRADAPYLYDLIVSGLLFKSPDSGALLPYSQHTFETAHQRAADAKAPFPTLVQYSGDSRRASEQNKSLREKEIPITYVLTGDLRELRDALRTRLCLNAQVEQPVVPAICAEPERVSILYVEDEPGVRSLFETVMGAHLPGAELVVAQNYDQAAALARGRRFTAIVTDNNLWGGALGQDLVVAAYQTHGPVNALVMSGASLRQALLHIGEHAPQANIVGVRKPVDINEFTKNLDSLLYAAQAPRK